MMKKFLIIGGNGFIGSHILDILLKENKFVRVFDQSDEVYRIAFEKVEYIQSSFDDSLSLAEALEDVDCVIHSISTSTPSNSNEFPIQDIQGNLINTITLLNLMVSKGIKRIVFLSSGGTVYGIPNKLPVIEEDPTNPICSYGIIKLAIEKYLMMYLKLYDLKPIILRISNPFGPRQSHVGHQGFITTLVSNFLKNEITNIYGDGKIIRDYIFIEDVARACYLAAISDMTGVYNVGYGIGYTLNEVVRIFEDIAGRKTIINYVKERRFDVPEIILGIEKIKSTFGWRPEISLSDGLKIHIDWATNIVK